MAAELFRNHYRNKFQMLSPLFLINSDLIMSFMSLLILFACLSGLSLVPRTELKFIYLKRMSIF